jgi:uncharacterized protein
MTEVLIKAAHGGRISVRRGQLLEILNVEGQQICDFFAFNADDLTERISPARCRSNLGHIALKVGDVLVSYLHRPMLRIVQDTCGVHDITFPPCDPIVYVQRFGLHNHRSCRTNLAEAISDFKIPDAFLPEPVNFFQNTPILADGTIEYRPSAAKAGDRVVLEALMDIIAVGSSCPYPGGINGDRPTDLKFIVRG